MFLTVWDMGESNFFIGLIFSFPSLPVVLISTLASVRWRTSSCQSSVTVNPPHCWPWPGRDCTNAFAGMWGEITWCRQREKMKTTGQTMWHKRWKENKVQAKREETKTSLQSSEWDCERIKLPYQSVCTIMCIKIKIIALWTLCNYLITKSCKLL